MSDFSWSNTMRIGIVHFKAFLQVQQGKGPVVETNSRVVEDDFWSTFKVGMI